MYVYTHVCIYVFMYVYVFICIYMYLCAHLICGLGEGAASENRDRQQNPPHPQDERSGANSARGQRELRELLSAQPHPTSSGHATRGSTGIPQRRL